MSVDAEEYTEFGERPASPGIGDWINHVKPPDAVLRCMPWLSAVSPAPRSAWAAQAENNAETAT